MFQFSKKLPELADRYGSLLALGGKKHLLVSLPANVIPGTPRKVWSALSRGFVVIVSQPGAARATTPAGKNPHMDLGRFETSNQRRQHAHRAPWAR